METRQANDFNIPAVASQETLRRLSTLIFHGGAVTSIFGAAAGTEKAAAAEQEARERHQAFINMVMATPEEMAAFDLKLTRLDEASTAALLENEEELRRAQADLDELRGRACEITLPNGEETKVYRDGSAVRNDDGGFIDREIIRGEDIPAFYPTWQELQAKKAIAQDAKQTYDEIVAYREKVEAAQEEIGDGRVSAARLEELESDLANMPAAVSRHYAQADAAPTNGATPKPSTFESDTRPTGAFATAASGVAVGSEGNVETELKPPRPDASVPAPR